MSKQFGYKQLLSIIATGAVASTSMLAHAAGFQIQEQNVTNLGYAYAGTAALAEDASTAFYNSAGLARLCNEQIVGSAIYIAPHNRLTTTSATTTTGALDIGAGGYTRVRGDAVSAAVHYFGRINDCWTFGLSLASPFGLKTNYVSDSIPRYTSTRAELRSYDIAPSLAYCFGNGLSVGIGPDFVYVQTRLDTAVGAGTAAFDGYLWNTVSRWAYGGHVGALWQISDCTRIGVNYRSQLKVKGKGDSNQLAFVGGPQLNQAVRATVTLPETAVISLYQQFGDCWAILADAQWTRWKRIQNLVLSFENGGRLSTPLNFKDTWRFAVGTHYKFNDCFLFRIGAAYDESPVRDGFRTAQVPDSNRYWLGLGGRFCLCKGLSLDVGYAHLFFKKGYIAQSAPRATLPTTQTAQRLVGNYKARADLVGIQLSWDL